MRTRFVVCVVNDGYPASLEARKVYAVIEDRRASQQGLMRVIDESGEGYLYDATMFERVKITDEAKHKLFDVVPS